MRKKMRGFTLIETLVAMMIVSGALVVLTNSWSGSMLAVRKSRNLSTAALLLQKKITELELKYEGRPASEYTDKEEGGDFGPEFKDFRWQLKTKKLELPDLSAGMTAREGGANDMEIMVIRKLTEYIEKSVIEMKVTVFQKGKEKDIEYTVTTYLVDYNQSLAGM